MKGFVASTVAFVAMVSPAAAFTVPQISLSKMAMSSMLNAVPEGWKGGWAESDPDFSYPRLSPDLSEVPVLDNMANIDLLTRQQKVLWPQFSWLAVPGNSNSRVYQMFAPDISRLGYTDDGRVYSIICPQQGFGSAFLGTLNVEVTVTGQRGWVKEPEHTVYADMGVTGRIWISAGEKTPRFVKKLQEKYDGKDFPFSKANAINVTTHNPGQPWNPIFKLKNGTDPSFPHPSYAQHWDEAYGVGYLDVEIGEIEKTGNENVDSFNQMILNIFNLGSGNILKKDSTLSWNVWFAEPELVNQTEWAEHAVYWRNSIDVDHTSPTGDGSIQTYFDGRKFKPLQSAIAQELRLITSWLAGGWKSSSGAASIKPEEEEDDMLHLMHSVDFDRYEDDEDYK